MPFADARYYDSFNRANSGSLGTADSGQTWTEVAGNLDIASNAVTAVSTGTNLLATQADGSITITATVSTKTTRIHFRQSDTSNYWEWGSNTSTLRLTKVVATVGTNVHESSLGVASGDIIQVDLDGSTIKAYINGVLKVTTVDSFNSTVTSHGLNIGTGGGADNFSVSVPIVATSATNAPTAQVKPNAGAVTATSVANGATVQTKSNAGTATAASVANASTAQAKPSAGNVSGTTVANSGTAAVKALAIAAGYAMGSVPGVVTPGGFWPGSIDYPPLSTATATTNAATPSLGAIAGAVAASAVASGVTAFIGETGHAENVAVSVVANSSLAGIAGLADTASGSVAANDATVAIGEIGFAEQASVAAATLDASVTLAVQAGAASVVAGYTDVSISVVTNTDGASASELTYDASCFIGETGYSEHATASVVANDATVSAASSSEAPAGVSTIAVTALGAQTAHDARAGTATAGAISLDSAVASAVLVQAVAASAVANGASIRVGVSNGDTGAGAEAQSIAQSDGDTSSSTDGSVLSPQGSDTGAGADAATPAAATLSRSDTAALTEARSILASLLAADAGSSGEAQSIEFVDVLELSAADFFDGADEDGAFAEWFTVYLAPWGVRHQARGRRRLRVARNTTEVYAGQVVVSATANEV